MSKDDRELNEEIARNRIKANTDSRFKTFTDGLNTLQTTSNTEKEE